MDELTSFQESARQIALERFRIIQPYLEQDKSLNVIAGKQESRIAQSSGFVGAPGPPRVSEADALQTAGPDWIYYSTRLRGAWVRSLAPRNLFTIASAASSTRHQ